MSTLAFSFRLVAPMIPIVLMSSVALASGEPPCLAATGVLDFLGAAETGERAFGNRDLASLQSARDRGLSMLPCLGEPVTTTDAAAFHRMMALEAFTAGDEPQVLREFHAARRLSPGYLLPKTVAPEGHPLVELYERSVGADEGQLEAAIPPLGGFVNIDGVRGAPRPTGISVIVQAFEKDASLVETRYLRPGDTLPAFGPLPVDQARRERRRRALLGATGASAVASGVLVSLAGRSNAAFWDVDDPVPDAELVAQHAQTNGLVWAAVATGAVTLGLGVATGVVW